MRRPSVEPTWRTIRVEGRNVELMEAGEGDPLLFLHGWGLSPRAYRDAVVRLCAAGVRVIAPSLPGFGRSDPIALSAPLTAWGTHVAAVVDELDPPISPFIVGHSFGGGVALQLAHQRADLVRSLTLISSVGGRAGVGAEPITDSSWTTWIRRIAGELDLREWLSPGLLPTMARDFAGNLRRHPLSLGTSMITALTASLADEARAVVAAGVPTLLVWGDRDGITLPGPLGEVSGDLGSEVVGGHHGWILTEPSEFARVVHDALVVHALLERRRRGMAETSPALRLPVGMALLDLLPPEHRHRARWP